MTASTLLIRTDASVSIGTGHVMRCLALAQAWQDFGGRTVFALAEATDATLERLRSESCEAIHLGSSPGSAEDAKETLACAQKLQTRWIVADGYRFDSQYQKLLKPAGCRLLLLDDYGHAEHYSADLVLNQNVCASQDLYSDCEADTQLLLGPRYALLRREFQEWSNWRREVDPVCRRVLITMGGSDPENLTARVIEALQLANLGALETTILVGGSNPHFFELQEEAQHRGLKIRFKNDVVNIGQFMADADFAVSAAGSTCWELCLLGLPSLLIDVADNQTEVARELHRRGCVVHIGNCAVSANSLAEGMRRLADSQELRRSLSGCSRQLVDGNGAKRVISMMCGAGQIRVRRATEEDRRLLWEWANDPSVRSASFSNASIPWETHVNWFHRKLSSPNTLMLIAEDDDGDPVGELRFEIEERDATLNVSLAKEKRGFGFAMPAIESAVRELFASSHCERVHAFVRLENLASKRTFEKAGFQRSDDATVRGHKAVHFILARGN